jgi:hypothetical protein
MFKDINVGVVADWLVTYAGAERVIKEFVEIFPHSEIYSVVDFLSDSSRLNIGNKSTNTTFIQKLPFAKRNINHIYL